MTTAADRGTTRDDDELNELLNVLTFHLDIDREEARAIVSRALDRALGKVT